ncbi:MAG TPA: DnaJ domain-containing protein [Opitutaceae bacterium]|nr:DnaJ domain-containing protein [Opitutaceae bacterium]
MTPAVSEDHYAILGVPENVGIDELRRVWRRLARRWHPDHAGAQSTASFQKIAAAYAVLCDPVARAAYDRRRGAAMPRTGAAAPAEPDAMRPRAPSVMLSRLCGSLNALLACGIARRVDEGVLELYLRAAEAKQGGMITIPMRVAVSCRKCMGRGAACPQCHGRGITDELFSAWLAVPPGIADGTVLLPSELLPGMVHPVRFLIRRPAHA